jgi:hypothetical protein
MSINTFAVQGGASNDEVLTEFVSVYGAACTDYKQEPHPTVAGKQAPNAVDEESTCVRVFSHTLRCMCVCMGNNTFAFTFVQTNSMC